MAQKKATIYILNVANTMSKDFSTALNLMTGNIEDKVMSGRKTDTVAVLLAGTSQTHNILADGTPGQYQRVTSMGPIGQPNVDLLKRIQNVSTSSEDIKPADVFDAVIVATQMIREYCKNLKYEKRIILITDNQNHIDWLDLEDVAGILKDINTELTVIGTDFKRVQNPNCPENIAINYKNWQLLIDSSETGGEILSLDTAYELTQMDSAKDVRPTPSFRGYLYIGNPHENDHVVGINVHMYLRTKTVPLPRSHKYSSHSNGPSHKVEPDVMYKYNANPTADSSLSINNVDEKVIDDKSRLEQAFRFGKTAIMISRDEVVSNKFTSKKELTIIGFINKRDFKRHYLYSNAYILTAGNYNTVESTLALSALAKALYDEQSCAIVRYVQKDDGHPRIGILEPENRQGEEDVEYLLQYFDLPFAEDIRDYKFKSITDPMVSDPKGIELMDNLIDSMDLDSTPDGKDYLTPEYTFNPILWRFSKAIKTRALNPDAPIPDIKESAKRQFEIYSGFKEKCSEYSELLASHLNVRKVIEKGKGKRKHKDINDNAASINAVDINALIGKANSFNDGPIYKPLTPTERSKSIMHNTDIETVGLITPVEDFLTLINKHSEVDMVEIAIKSMSQAIIKLLTISFGSQNYPMVIKCLKVVRKTAAEEDAAVNYNKHIREVKQWCNLSNKTSPRYKFWEMLKEEKLGLITNEECNDIDNADTTREIAEKFWNTDEEEDHNMAGETEIVGADNEDIGFNADDLDDLL